MDDDMFKRTRLYDRDRISALPDCLILEILSHLPTTKDAIRTSCLSKRWTSLWTLLPNLILINDKHSYPDSVCFFSFLDRTIARASRSPLKLNKFQLHSTYYVPEHESQVNTWLRYAINRNVQHLDLTLGFIDFITHIIVLDELLFHNSIFTHLKLACSFVNPTGTFSWINLKSLYISKTNLNEDLLQNILSGSPVLATFTLDNCYGFEQLDFTSKSVKKLVISGETSFGGVLTELNAPNILSLKIQGSVILDDILLGDLSSLVQAHLDYTADDPTLDDIELEQDNLVECILSLLHVKELKLGPVCSKLLSQFLWRCEACEAEGFIAPSNIKHVVDNGPEGEEVEGEEVD